MFVADNSCCRFQLYYSWLHLVRNVAIFRLSYSSNKYHPLAQTQTGLTLAPFTSGMIENSLNLGGDDLSNLN